MLDIIFALDPYRRLPFCGRINHVDIQRAMVEAGEYSVELLLQVRKRIAASPINPTVFEEVV
jgi:hypothetical protein